MPKNKNGSRGSDKQYDIGYGKPPRGRPWEKGCPSPNAGGRPRKPKDLTDVMVRLGREKVSMKVDGVIQKRSLIEWFGRSIYQDALQNGSWRAREHVFASHREAYSRQQMVPIQSMEPRTIEVEMVLEEEPPIWTREAMRALQAASMADPETAQLLALEALKALQHQTAVNHPDWSPGDK